MHGAIEAHLLAIEGAGVEVPHVPAPAAEQVLRVAAAAEGLDVDVDDVGAGRGQAPDEVLAPPNQDVPGERRRRGAARPPARALEVHLERQAGIEVADLRAAHEQRVSRAGPLSGHHQHVARMAAELAVHGGRCRCARGRDRLVRPVVDHHVAGSPRRQRCVREPAADGDRGLRVLALAQVVPDRVAPVRAELVLKAVEHLGGIDLVATALAEQLALDRVQRDHVADRPGPVRPVVGAVVRVDALHVHAHVVEQAAAALAVLPELSDLLAQLALSLRARPEGLQPHDQADRADVRNVEHGHARVEPRLLEQQLAVVSERPAGAPGHVVVRAAADVRNVVPVAEDADAAARHALAPHPALAPRPELLGLEVAAEVAPRHVVEQRRERVVHPCLAVRLGRDRTAPHWPDGTMFSAVPEKSRTAWAGAATAKKEAAIMAAATMRFTSTPPESAATLQRRPPSGYRGGASSK